MFFYLTIQRARTVSLRSKTSPSLSLRVRGIASRVIVAVARRSRRAERVARPRRHRPTAGDLVSAKTKGKNETTVRGTHDAYIVLSSRIARPSSTSFPRPRRRSHAAVRRGDGLTPDDRSTVSASSRSSRRRAPTAVPPALRERLDVGRVPSRAGLVGWRLRAVLAPVGGSCRAAARAQSRRDLRPTTRRGRCRRRGRSAPEPPRRTRCAAPPRARQLDCACTARASSRTPRCSRAARSPRRRWRTRSSTKHTWSSREREQRGRRAGNGGATSPSRTSTHARRALGDGDATSPTPFLTLRTSIAVSTCRAARA